MAKNQIVSRERKRALEQNRIVEVAGCEEMKTKYIDLIEFMEQNVEALQELLAKCQAQSTVPKYRNHQLTSSKPAKIGIEIELRQEIDQLKAQLEVYRNDFAVERIARQALEMEKEQLIAELQQLKLHNHNQILKPLNGSVKQQVHYWRRKSVYQESGVWHDEFPQHELHPEVPAMHCSLCNQIYGDIHALETHIDDCPAY